MEKSEKFQALINEMDQIKEEDLMYEYGVASLERVRLEPDNPYLNYQREACHNRALTQAAFQTEKSTAWLKPLFKAHKEKILSMGNYEDYFEWSFEFQTKKDLSLELSEEDYAKYIEETDFLNVMAGKQK